MLILLRKTRLKNGNIVEQSDSELRLDQIAIGSDNHCDMQLFGQHIAPQHAEVDFPNRDQLRIRCRPQCKVSVDGRTHDEVELNIGQWANFDQHRIAMITTPPGFDAALELQIDHDSQQSLQLRYQQDIELKLPRNRRNSYLLAGVVLLATLLIPLLGYLQPEAGAQLRKLGAPSDALWSSGPLSGPHHLLDRAEDCNSCHLKGFQQVPDSACINCHKSTHQHLPSDHALISGDNMQCESCHKEHNEPATLIVENNSQCTSCHRDSLSRSEKSISGSKKPDLAPASAFSSADHPAFQLSLLQQIDDKWLPIKTAGDQPAKEASNLKFPHDVHLNADKVHTTIDSNLERGLACVDCHIAAPDGEHFETLGMEQSCAACHLLEFDDSQATRRLPHDSPDVVYTFLKEFFVTQAAQKKGPTPQARRVPAKRAEALCESDDPLVCGERWAAAEMDTQFNKGGCVDCHEVYTENGSWQLKPVRLNRDWYPSSHFSHRKHQIMPDIDENAENCGSCHQAKQSDNSADILIPGIDNCMDCHDDHSPQSLPLQCIDCHAFHRDALPAMGTEK